MSRAMPSLGARLTRQFLLLGVLPVIAVFVAAWALLLPVLVGQAEARNRELALAVRDQVALQLDLRVHSATVLADGVANSAGSTDDKAGSRRALRVLLDNDRFLQAVFVADANGRVVDAVLPERSGRYVEDVLGLDLTGQLHVVEARARRSPVWSDVFLSTLTGDVTAALVLPAGEGLVVLELSLSALSRSVTDLAQSGNARVVVVDRAGRVIAHPDPRQALQQVSLYGLAPVPAALGGVEGSARTRLDGVEQLVHVVPVAPVGWAVVTTQPVATVMAPLVRLGGAVVAVLAMTVVVAAIVGWRLARRTGREVELLADGAQHAALGAALPPALHFSTAEFTAVWTRLRDLFQQLAERDDQTRAAQQDLQAVLDAATQVAIVATDPAGTVTVFNVGAQRMLGWRADEVVGRLTPLAWHDAGELAERARELGVRHGQAIEGAEVLFVEARHSGYEVRDWCLVRRDGSRLDVSLAVTAMHARDGALKGFLAVAVDVTERRRAAELELARTTAEAASQAKSDFLSRMSHELRTPLNAILGYAQLIEIDADQSPPASLREHVQHIQTAGWHLVRLIDDVLDLARIEAGHMRVAVEPVELAPLLHQVARLVAPQCERHGVSLVVTAPPADTAARAVAADPTRLLQVLVNLAGNAAKYNRPQGEVRLSWRTDGASVRLTVADTGRGMTPEQLEHLFEPFNRLGRETTGIEGTGIGLVITRHLVELMQGRLEVRSTPGVGTTFDVVLPLAGQAGAVDAPPPPAVAAPGPGQTPVQAAVRVLYIEDNDANAQLMRAILRQRPHLTLEVRTNAVDGLAAAQREPPDLVLLDMHLQDAHGEQVLAALRADPRLARVPVVVVSADATRRQIEAMREQGVLDYLTKPLNVAATLQVIDAALARASDAAASVAARAD